MSSTEVCMPVPSVGTSPSALTERDLRNQAGWAAPAARRERDSNKLYTDPGEAAALAFVRERIRGQPILDLGVGLGRTIPILKPLTKDYRAIDYMAQMVKTCRERYPDARVDVGDARDLEGFPSDYFGLVQFSFNGIDAGGAEDRRRILRGARRVLVSGGTFLFSSLNMNGPGYRERPWRIDLPRTRNPARFAWDIVRPLRWMPLHVINWAGLRKFEERGLGYGVSPLPAHHWTLVAHFTTLERQLEELSREGFSNAGPVFDNKHGKPVHVGDDTTDFDWLHIVAVKV